MRSDDPRGARREVPPIIDSVLRVGEGRILRKLKRISEQINSIEDDFAAMSDAELRAMTDEFRQRYADSETLDDLLPEAFAAVREAAKRTLGQRAFDVQLMGSAALHLGNIAEMKTGEGKTLTGVFPAYLNALAWQREDCVQRGHNYAIVDEVDSILIDEARTPLIISGPAEQSPRWYTEFAKIAPRLRRGEDGEGDYEVDEKKKTVGILESGVEKVEDWLGIDNLYDPVNTPLV